MGGTIESSVSVSGEQENVKKTLEAALSIPGLAGVTMAIVNEGAQTRKVLGRILDEMKGQRGTSGVSAPVPQTRG
jgi:autotransporter translocation and assembly factor TamB